MLSPALLRARGTVQVDGEGESNRTLQVKWSRAQPPELQDILPAPHRAKTQLEPLVPGCGMAAVESCLPDSTIRLQPTCYHPELVPQAQHMPSDPSQSVP